MYELNLDIAHFLEHYWQKRPLLIKGGFKDFQDPISPDELAGVKFDAGSMGPKVEASCEFVKATGGMVGIGSLEDGLAILKGEAGTNIVATRTVHA